MPNVSESAADQPADIMGRFVSVEERVYSAPTHYYGIDSEGVRHHVSHAALADSVESYEQIEEKTYKRPRHVYGVDAAGTRHHLSHRSVLEHYGYSEHPTPQEDYEARLAAAQVSQYTPTIARETQAPRVRRIAALGGMLLGASVKIAELPGRAIESYQSTNTRNKAMIKVAGALAVGVAAYLTYRYAFSGSSPEAALPHPKSVPPGHEYIPQPKPHVHMPNPHLPKDPDEISLPKYNARTGAGTVWNTVQRYAGMLGFHHLNNAKVEQLTAATLKKNHLTWEQARHLPSGFLVHMLSPKTTSKLLK